MNGNRLNLQLRIWRQADSRQPGKLVTYQVKDISKDMSFLEMIDVLNEDLIRKGELPVEFDSDCREGICGTCGMMINGVAHGPLRGTTVCQLHMRHFTDGQTITIEPWRAKAFPPVKDLVVDRSAFDRVISVGGYVSVSTGGAPDGNVIPISKNKAERALDSASCIGCGACVAACPNASAALFTGAKIAQYTFLPQGQVERLDRARRMVRQMDLEGFGNCSNHGECEAVCPKRISIQDIAIMRREFFKLMVR
jgi:succinate dehydrogenase / fumarate reductase, iron-sulfur subunit